jgi:hypothetical protein
MLFFSKPPYFVDSHGVAFSFHIYGKREDLINQQVIRFI